MKNSKKRECKGCNGHGALLSYGSMPYICETCRGTGKTELGKMKDELVEVIRSIVQTIPIAGDWDRTKAIYPNDKCVDALAEAVRAWIKEKMPKGKPTSPHDGHVFDENYCFNCQKCVDEESDEWQNLGNYKYNRALSDVKTSLGIK